MTVGELKQKLVGISDETPIALFHEGYGLTEFVDVWFGMLVQGTFGSLSYNTEFSNPDEEVRCDRGYMVIE